MSELPKLRLRGTDGEYEVTPENGVLYRHFGAKAIYDYILMVTEEKEQEREGYPIFLSGFLDTDSIDKVTEFMRTRMFETHLNVKNVNPTVVEAYERVLAKQMDDIDTIPEEWLGGLDEQT